MKIYMVELYDYDTKKSVGYFTERKRAESCCEYLNRAGHSVNEEIDWFIAEYNLDKTDYDSLNKKLDEQERIKFENRLNKEKQKAIAEIERLKAKYKL